MRAVPDEDRPAWLRRYEEQSRRGAQERSRRDAGEPAPDASTRYEELLRCLWRAGREPLPRPDEP